MSSVTADIFRQAAQLNTEDPRRRGATVHLASDQLDIVVSGDIHGNRSSLAKIIDYAAVGSSPSRLLILQEIVHGPLDARTGHDRSVEVLLRAARLKVSHSQNVIFLMGNHDLAQVTGNEINKDGRGVCRSFDEGVEFCFGAEAPDILDAIKELAISMPLAVRCPNNVMVIHSLPSPHRMHLAGLDVLDRPYAEADFLRGGAAYEWTWGRDQTDQQTDQLAEQLGVEFFVLGHQYTPDGWQMVTSRAVAIASDHAMGCVVHFDTAAALTAETITDHIKPLRSLSRN